MVTDPKSWTGGQNKSKMHFLTEKWTFFCLSMFFKEVLHNHFNIYVNILSLTCPVTSPIPDVVSQNFTNKSCLVCVKSEKYACWVTLRPQWDCYRRGIRSEFQLSSQTAPVEAKPRCVYSILKPHGQSSRCQVRLLPPRRSRGAYTHF